MTPNRGVLEVAQILVRPGTEDDFVAAYTGARPVLAATPGCRSVRMTRGVESPSRFTLLVEWDSVEAHETNFRGTERFEQWRAAIGPHFAEPPVVEHYRDVDTDTDSGLDRTGRAHDHRRAHGRVERPLAAVFAYLADFTHTEAVGPRHRHHDAHRATARCGSARRSTTSPSTAAGGPSSTTASCVSSPSAPDLHRRQHARSRPPTTCGAARHGRRQASTVITYRAHFRFKGWLPARRALPAQGLRAHRRRDRRPAQAHARGPALTARRYSGRRPRRGCRPGRGRSR